MDKQIKKAAKATKIGRAEVQQVKDLCPDISIYCNQRLEELKLTVLHRKTHEEQTEHFTLGHAG